MGSPPSFVSSEPSRRSPLRLSDLASPLLCSPSTVIPLLSTTWIVTTHNYPNQSSPAWPSTLFARRCLSSKVTVLTLRQRRPAAPSLSGSHRGRSPMAEAYDRTEHPACFQCRSPLPSPTVERMCILSLVDSFSPLRLTLTFLKVRFCPSCSANSSRADHGDNVWVAHIPKWILSRVSPEDLSSPLRNRTQCLNDIATGSRVQFLPTPPHRNCCLSMPNFSKFGFPTFCSGFMSDEFFSFKERVRLSSSQWERSFSTPSGWIDCKSHQCSITLVPSRLRPEENCGVRPQVLLVLVASTSTDLESRCLSNSTLIESTLKSDTILAIMLIRCDETHVDFFEILQNGRELKKCIILVFVICVYFLLSWIVCVNRNVFGLVSIVCIGNV